MSVSRTRLFMGEPFTAFKKDDSRAMVAVLNEMSKDEVLRFIPMDAFDWEAMLWEETIPFELVEQYKLFIPKAKMRAPYISADVRSFGTVLGESWYYTEFYFSMWTYEQFRPLMNTKLVHHVDDNIIEKYHAELDTWNVSTYSAGISLASLDKFDDPEHINWDAIYERYGWGSPTTFWFQRKYIKYDRRLYRHLN